MSKRLLLTFDYELFLGAQSGSVKDCLLDPTYKLSHLLKQNRLKGIFFVDTVYLLQLNRIATKYSLAQLDLNAIRLQLQTLIDEGHYIFPHIHPHWLDAEYIVTTNEWSLQNTRYYQFSALNDNQREELFQQSVGLLRQLFNIDYPISSHRAGGWSAQPFSCFKPVFEQNGIQNEWSVIPGKYLFSDAHSFDFRKAPILSPIYRFSQDICLEDKQGQYTEWTISSIKLTRFEKWLNFKVTGLIARLSGPKRIKGTTVSSSILDEGDIYESPQCFRIVASFEGLNPYLLFKYLSAIRRLNYFQFISHPKLISDFEFIMIKYFFKLMSFFKVESDFRKM